MRDRLGSGHGPLAGTVAGRRRTGLCGFQAWDSREPICLAVSGGFGTTGPRGGRWSCRAAEAAGSPAHPGCRWSCGTVADLVPPVALLSGALAGSNTPAGRWFPRVRPSGHGPVGLAAKPLTAWPRREAGTAAGTTGGRAGPADRFAGGRRPRSSTPRMARLTLATGISPGSAPRSQGPRAGLRCAMSNTIAVVIAVIGILALFAVAGALFAVVRKAGNRPVPARQETAAADSSVSPELAAEAERRVGGGRLRRAANGASKKPAGPPSRSGPAPSPTRRPSCGGPKSRRSQVTQAQRAAEEQVQGHQGGSRPASRRPRTREARLAEREGRLDGELRKLEQRSTALEASRPNSTPSAPSSPAWTTSAARYWSGPPGSPPSRPRPSSSPPSRTRPSARPR